MPPPHGTFDVTVGQGFAFVPDTFNIHVGDTVPWTWASSGHGVSSGIRVRSMDNFVRLTIRIARQTNTFQLRYGL